MTEQEAIDEIEKMAKCSDHEAAHIFCEVALLDFLRANGYEELAESYGRASQNFHYA